MGMKKYFALLLLAGPALAQDVTVEMPSDQENVRKTLTVCSDNTFDVKLISLGLTPIELNELPKPFYTTINTLMLEPKAELDKVTWRFSHPNDAQTNYDPEGNQVFIIDNLIDGVGIFIHSPYGAASIHVDKEDYNGQKLYNLIDSLPDNVYGSATITLVSSGYSKIFRLAYEILKGSGFTHIFADIEPVVITRPSPNEICKYVKASTLNKELKHIQGVKYEDIMSYNNKNQIVASRSLIAHAQIGDLYMFKNYQYRNLDPAAHYDLSKAQLSIIEQCPKKLDTVISSPDQLKVFEEYE